MFDRAGNWTGQETITREQIKHLLVNYSESYPLALKELYRLDWIDKPETGASWTAKGRADLRAVLYWPHGE